MIGSYRDTVVAVLHKVDLSQLVQAHGRQLYPTMKGPINPHPPLLHARLGGHEATIEVPVAADAANYLGNLYDPPAQIEPVVRVHRLSGLIEGRQHPLLRNSPKTGGQPPEEGPVSGTQELLVHLFFEAHVLDHLLLLSC
jgi:hypothetical protein